MSLRFFGVDWENVPINRENWGRDLERPRQELTGPYGLLLWSVYLRYWTVDVPPVAAPSTVFTIAKASRITNIPSIAYRIIFFALSSDSCLPAAVTYVTPPKIIIITATIPKNVRK